jgi:hypothetical protein
MASSKCSMRQSGIKIECPREAAWCLLSRFDFPPKWELHLRKQDELVLEDVCELFPCFWSILELLKANSETGIIVKI